MFKKTLSIILIPLSFSLSFASYADSKGEYEKIQHHWEMILQEKDVNNRSNMIKEHRMMLDDFEKSGNMNAQHNGMQGSHMQGNHMQGMSGEQIHMMNSMGMQRLEMDMME